MKMRLYERMFGTPYHKEGAMARTRHYRVWALLAVIAALLLSGSALAAEIGSGDVYRLGAGQVVSDDLVVTAREIYIDGTVKGDLVALGQYVEVNGTVEGDLMAAAAEVRIGGTVTDDVRVAGVGTIISGTIGDDLFAAAGGGEGGVYPITINGRSIQQGLQILSGANIGGTVYVGAGSASVAGTVAQDLKVGAGQIDLRGNVKGNADLSAQTLSVAPGARVDGSLSYTAPSEAAVPSGAAEAVRYTPPPPPQPQDVPTGRGVGWQITRIILTLLGFVLVGTLLLRYAPASVRRPAEAIAAQPGRASLYGLAVIGLLFIIPIVSLLALIAMIVLWGWFPGLMFVLFITAALALAWTLSPLVTGLWLGRALLRAAGREWGDLLALLSGATLIVLLSYVPLVGWLVSLASLILAVGGLLLARRGSFDVAAPASTPVAA